MLLQVFFHSLLNIYCVVIFTDFHLLNDLHRDGAQVEEHANNVWVILADALFAHLSCFLQNEIKHLIFELIFILESVLEVRRRITESLLVQRCAQHSIPGYVNDLPFLFIASLHILQEFSVIDLHFVGVEHLLTFQFHHIQVVGCYGVLKFGQVLPELVDMPVNSEAHIFEYSLRHKMLDNHDESDKAETVAKRCWLADMPVGEVMLWEHWFVRLTYVIPVVTKYLMIVQHPICIEEHAKWGILKYLVCLVSYWVIHECCLGANVGHANTLTKTLLQQYDGGHWEHDWHANSIEAGDENNVQTISVQPTQIIDHVWSFVNWHELKDVLASWFFLIATPSGVQKLGKFYIEKLRDNIYIRQSHHNHIRKQDLISNFTVPSRRIIRKFTIKHAPKLMWRVLFQICVQQDDNNTRIQEITNE